MINNIKTIVYHRTLCVSVVLSSELTPVLENFRKPPPYIFNNFLRTQRKGTKFKGFFWTK